MISEMDFLPGWLEFRPRPDIRSRNSLRRPGDRQSPTGGYRDSIDVGRRSSRSKDLITILTGKDSVHSGCFCGDRAVHVTGVSPARMRFAPD